MANVDETPIFPTILAIVLCWTPSLAAVPVGGDELEDRLGRAMLTVQRDRPWRTPGAALLAPSPCLASYDPGARGGQETALGSGLAEAVAGFEVELASAAPPDERFERHSGGCFDFLLLLGEGGEELVPARIEADSDVASLMAEVLVVGSIDLDSEPAFGESGSWIDPVDGLRERAGNCTSVDSAWPILDVACPGRDLGHDLKSSGPGFGATFRF